MKSSAYEELNIPPIEYPMPISGFKSAVVNKGDFSLAQLCYWMMCYLDERPEDDETYREALLSIAEKHAPVSDAASYWLGSDEPPGMEWSVFLGQVDLTQACITVEGEEDCVPKCAFARNNISDRANCCLFTAPACSLVRKIIANNRKWEQESGRPPFDAIGYMKYASHKLATAYARRRKEDTFVCWDFGIGFHSPEDFDDRYEHIVGLNPIPSDWTAFFIEIVQASESVVDQT